MPKHAKTRKNIPKQSKHAQNMQKHAKNMPKTCRQRVMKGSKHDPMTECLRYATGSST